LKELAQRSLFDPDHAISTIQASLILCLWQFPVDSVFKDQSHVMAGAAMQLAIQKGLPYSSRKQDFVRVAMKQSEADKLFQAQLWAYCVIVFQRYVSIAGPLFAVQLTEFSVSLGDGYLFPMITDPVNFDRNISILNCLPHIVLYRYRLHLIQTDAITTIVRTTDLDSTKDSNLLNSLIDHFDTQAQQISSVESDHSSEFFSHAVWSITELDLRPFCSPLGPSLYSSFSLLQRAQYRTQFRNLAGLFHIL
jgi:hypothetical protein